MILLIAGSRDEANAYAAANELPDGRWRIVQFPEDLSERKYIDKAFVRVPFAPPDHEVRWIGSWKRRPWCEVQQLMALTLKAGYELPL